MTDLHFVIAVAQIGMQILTAWLAFRIGVKAKNVLVAAPFVAALLLMAVRRLTGLLRLEFDGTLLLSVGDSLYIPLAISLLFMIAVLGIHEVMKERQ
ncbi:MAG: hypothetical protein ACPHCN_17920 [Mycobacterium sp.]